MPFITAGFQPDELVFDKEDKYLELLDLNEFTEDEIKLVIDAIKMFPDFCLLEIYGDGSMLLIPELTDTSTEMIIIHHVDDDMIREIAKMLKSKSSLNFPKLTKLELPYSDNITVAVKEELKDIFEFSTPDGSCYSRELMCSCMKDDCDFTTPLTPELVGVNARRYRDGTPTYCKKHAICNELSCGESVFEDYHYCEKHLGLSSGLTLYKL